jgi:aryl-alcohol dehydrogenase-like predicted oxidoreductase
VAEVAKERGISMAQIALAWLWSKPVVAAPILGSPEGEAHRRRNGSCFRDFDQ